MTSLETMYAGQPNSPSTTLTGSIMAASTTINVLDASVLPSEVPFLLTLGFDQPISETVLVTNSSENVLTVTRGVDGVATEWPSDTRCARTFTSLDLNTVQENITALNNGKQEEITTSGLLKGDGSGSISAAQAGVDYQAPLTAGVDYQAPLTAGTDYATPTQLNDGLADKQNEITVSGILKGTGDGNVSAAVAGTDYQTPLTAGTDYVTPTQLAGKQDEITASGLLKGDGAGNVSAAVAGTDYQAPLTAGVDYLPMSGGTMTGQLQANATSQATLSVQQVRNIYFGTAEMEDGVSDLPAGVLYFQYDAGV